MVWDALEYPVNVCEGLDWKRILSLHLWYGCSPVAPIQEVLGEYIRAFQVNYITWKAAVVGVACLTLVEFFHNVWDDPYAPPPLPHTWNITLPSWRC